MRAAVASVPADFTAYAARSVSFAPGRWIAGWSESQYLRGFSGISPMKRQALASFTGHPPQALACAGRLPLHRRPLLRFAHRAAWLSAARGLY